MQIIKWQRYCLFFAIIIALNNDAIAQPTQLGTQTVNGAYNSYTLTDLGIFRQARIQATSAAASGTRNWEFYEAPFDYDPAWRPYAAGLTLASYNQHVVPVVGTASALFNIGFGGSAGLMPAITNGNYYTFNVTEYSTPGIPLDESMGVLETNYNPVNINSVSQTPAIGAVYPENSVYVTVTTSAPPSAGEYVYLRYATTVNFAASFLLTVTMIGATGTVEIPCQPSGTTVYYYVYTSNRTSAVILADVGATNQRAHDMSTLSINNSGGPNYIYTVLPSVGFCGNYYVPSVCYPTIASFVTAINVGSVSCNVVCNVAAGHTETAPVGGINLTRTGTAANTITFIKNGIGANPIIYAPVGTVVFDATDLFADGIFSINGSDYITIDAIDLVDNNTTGAAMMEYGYAFFKPTNTDGCSNNIIRNCSISLKNTNYWTSSPTNFEFGSVGILMRNSPRTLLMPLLVITAASGRSDNNQFYSNQIIGAFNGIVIAGYNDIFSPYSYYDQNNSIGIAGAGNIIHKWGYNVGTSRAIGVFATYNTNLIISDNEINNSASGGTAHNNTLYGIFISGQTITNYFQDITIQNNTISLLLNGISTNMTGIRVGTLPAGGTSVRIIGNIIENCTYAAASTSAFLGIDQQLNATTVQIEDNIIQNNTLNSTTTSVSYLIYNTVTSSNVSVKNNQLLNNNKTLNSAGGFYGYYGASASATGSITFEDNIIDGLSVGTGSTGYAVGARITSSINQLKYINNNQISNIVGGSGIGAYTTALNVDFMPSGSTVNGNTIANVSSSAASLGINCGGSTTVSSSSNQIYTISNNTVDNVSTISAGSHVVGMFAHALSSLNCFNNSIDGVTSTGTLPLNLNGLRIGGGAAANSFNIYNNEVLNVLHNNTLSVANPTGVYLFTNSNTLNFYKNHVSDISGLANETVIGVYVTSGSGAQNIYNNFIQRLSAPNASNSLSVNGIYVAAGGNTYNVYNNTVALGYEGVLSGGTGFGATGFYHGAGLLDLRNNIIYVNANASGTGVVSCLRKPTAGVAGTAPATTSISATTNNNFYYLNMAANNYVYVEGTTTSTIKNGYAYGGATTSVLNNLNNDPCFNILTAGNIMSYKYFMSLGGGGTREVNSFYDVPNFVGGGSLPANLKIVAGALDYAESHATAIATPAITTDYEGDIRFGNPGYIGTGTAPDIGADEGEFVLATPACFLLPIEILSFTGWYNGISNELHWTTATEINSDYFEIQRSLNGADFNPIGTIDAAGNSVSPLNYIFYDDAPYSGINYYRLRMVDIDGAYDYSNIIAIRIANTSGDITVYPNPATDNITIEFNAITTGTLTFNLLDVTGRKVMHINEQVNEGINIFNYAIAHLPTSSYLIQFTNPNTGETNGIKLFKY